MRKEGVVEKNFSSDGDDPQRREVCRAQLNVASEQSHVDSHLEEHQWQKIWVSKSSVHEGKQPSPSSDASVIM